MKISDEAMLLRNAIAEMYRPKDWRDSEWQPVFLEADEIIQRALDDARNRALGEAAVKARHACLVPPDGGSPTPDKVAVCELAALSILALKVPS